MTQDGALGRGELKPEDPLVSVGEALLDRMPALPPIFEEAAATFARSLEELSDAPVALLLEDVEAKRLCDLREQIVLVYRAHGFDAKIAVGVNEGFRNLLVELLLGAGVVEPSQDGERAISRIEMRLLLFAVEELLSALAKAFAPVAEVTFRGDRFDAEAGLGALAQKGAVAIVARCRLKCLGREGDLAIVIPRSALDPFQAKLSRLRDTEGFLGDERWSENLYDHVVRAEVRIKVELEARGLTLADIANLEVGDVLRLASSPMDPICIRSEGRALFRGALGQKDGRYAVRVVDFSDEKECFIESVLRE